MSQIQGPKTGCVNDVVSVTYKAPAGLTLVSVSWTFGDGSSGTGISVQHFYRNTGDFTVTANAGFSNGSSRNESITIRIVGLPKASFYLLSKSDSCLSRNRICFKDMSTPANGQQPIVKRYFVWGDGAFDSTNSPNHGDELCHRYNGLDKYSVNMEVRDIHGCKSMAVSKINIVEQTKASFSVTNVFKDCYKKEVCLRNISTGKHVGTAAFKWITDNTTIDNNRYFIPPKCMEFTGNVNMHVKLVVMDQNGCSDTVQQTVSVLIDSIAKKLDLDDTVTCYSSKDILHGSFTAMQNDRILWSIDSKGMNSSGSNLFQFNAASAGILPGIHTLYARIIRGKCTTTLSRRFVVHGPLAGLKILDGDQCFSNRKVYFVDNSKFVNRNTTRYYWTLQDPGSDTCIIHREKNINLYKNCTHSRDWYTKHSYTSKAAGKSKVTLWIKDTVTGCVSVAEDTVDMKNCSPLITVDSMNICQGRQFLGSKQPGDPRFVSLDSGKTWVKYPVMLPPDLIGVLDVGFIFETVLPEWAETIGNDSIRLRTDTLRIYDTLFKKAYLHIHGFKKDSVFAKLYGNCGPFRYTVYFKGGQFNKGDKLIIDWGDGTSYQTAFAMFTKIDSVSKVYKGSGLNRTVSVGFSNEGNCGKTLFFYPKAGKIITVNPVGKYYCKGQSPICFVPSVYDTRSGTYWKTSTGNNKVSWKFSDSGSSVNVFSTCRNFSKRGQQYYELMVEDSLGCKDTVRDSLFIQDMKADVKNHSRLVYCSELKQFFDSTRFLKSRYDSIISYNWDFGTGKFTNPQKNPFKALNTSAEKITVVHTVKTLYGCTDTIRFDLRIVGPHPYFTLRDTLGCESLSAVFDNRSGKCSGYIWEFGDPAQTSLSTDKTTPAGFHYTKPGRYHIRLYGFDSVYNPSTKTTYFCSNYFPDPLYQKDSVRAVTVLDKRKTAIAGPEVVCAGKPFTLVSLSDSMYDIDVWKLELDSTRILQSRNSITFTYWKPGIYQARLAPRYLIDTSRNICTDTAFKTIAVEIVKAGFDIDPGNKAPIFLFHNASAPSDAALHWDFGHPASKSLNYSSKPAPSHNYWTDTGSYTVCLVATTRYGCKDTVCKPVYSDYVENLELYNVFTPGNTDDMNDKYDIVIIGEETYHLRIYDRWGILVFESFEDADNSGEGNWNGRIMNTGENCPAGTFYYIFDYSLGKEPWSMKTVNGTISLIR